jgi:hypothetical protein
MTIRAISKSLLNQAGLLRGYEDFAIGEMDTKSFMTLGAASQGTPHHRTITGSFIVCVHIMAFKGFISSPPKKMTRKYDSSP